MLLARSVCAVTLLLRLCLRLLFIDNGGGGVNCAKLVLKNNTTYRHAWGYVHTCIPGTGGSAVQGLDTALLPGRGKTCTVYPSL